MLVKVDEHFVAWTLVILIVLALLIVVIGILLQQ